jgi:hypothetical protein
VIGVNNGPLDTYIQAVAVCARGVGAPTGAFRSSESADQEQTQLLRQAREQEARTR